MLKGVILTCLILTSFCSVNPGEIGYLTGPLKMQEERKVNIQEILEDIRSGKAFAIPAKGQVSLPIRTFPLPRGARIVALETQPLEPYLFAGDLINKLQNFRGNVLYWITISDKPRKEDLQAISAKVKEIAPDVLLLPSPLDPRSSVQKARQAILKASTASAKIEIAYETAQMFQGYNFYHFFSEETKEKKVRAIQAHESQVKRLAFDEATIAANQANALLYQVLTGQRTDEKYAERFLYQQMVDGKLRDVKADSFPFLKRRNTVVIISPHPDDLEIAAGAFAADRIEQGDRVINVVVTTGHRPTMPPGILDLPTQAHMYPEAVKAVREKESRTAGKILGIPERDCISLRCEFYDYKDKKGNNILKGPHAQRDRKRIRQTLERIYQEHQKQFPEGRWVVALPQKSDTHPTHQATYTLVMEALEQLSRENHQTIDLLFYVAPWAGEANVYNYIPQDSIEQKKSYMGVGLDPTRLQMALHFMKAYAITGTELVTGFGEMPHKPQDLQGVYAERFWIREIKRRPRQRDSIRLDRSL